MKWWHMSAVLCSYGFFKEFRPSEPFISPYLETFKNFSISEISEEIYPVGTYCYLSLLVAVFLLTDYLRYKPILLGGSISGVVTWSLLIWGTGTRQIQVAEFFYGFFLASEVAYYTYIYAKVDKRFYQKVTSHTRAAILLGKASAGLFSQLLVFFGVNYLELNYFTVFCLGITILLALLLPSVPQSLYFHHKETEIDWTNNQTTFPSADKAGIQVNDREEKQESFVHKWKVAFARLYEDFKHAFSKMYVLRWSIWWALATCGYLQAISYCQILWQDINHSANDTLYHGYVELAFAVTGAAVALGVGYLSVPWNKWGEIFVGFLTISQGALLFYSAYLGSLYVSYVIFILFRDIYEAAITIATFEVAKFINQDSCALIFGINTFAALVLQSVLTAVVLGTLRMHIKDQFRVYGGYHFVTGLAFLIYGISSLILRKKNNLCSKKRTVRIPSREKKKLPFLKPQAAP